MTLASFFERYLVMIAKKNFIGLLIIKRKYEYTVIKVVQSILICFSKNDITFFIYFSFILSSVVILFCLPDAHFVFQEDYGK